MEKKKLFSKENKFKLFVTLESSFDYICIYYSSFHEIFTPFSKSTHEDMKNIVNPLLSAEPLED